MKQPLVSIVCESFNHEPFLRRCIEGFLMQKTDFPFEILIHDDASTDKSAEIIREYETKHPDWIKAIYQTENQYSKVVSIWAEIQFPRARGKYIALCEGDDCWTDPLKLQKQVDYMEAHPECSLCFHNAIIRWDDGQHPDRHFAEIEERDYSFLETLKQWYIPTASILFRAELREGFKKFRCAHPLISIGDRALAAYCSQQGVLHGLKDVMSVYLKHESGFTHYSDARRTFAHARAWEELGTAFGKTAKRSVEDYYTVGYLSAFARAVRERNFQFFFKSFYRGIIRQPITGVRVLLRVSEERQKRVNS
jgi:glycosyltransferase involved in cell wall biosynthesis